MLFTKLFPLLALTGLTLDVKKTEENKIKLIIKFKVKDEKSEKINLNPLVLEGTPEEFDNGLIDELIEQMNVSVPTILSQINVLTVNLKNVLESKTKAAASKKTTTAKKEDESKSSDLFVENKENNVTAPPKRKRRSKAQIEADNKAKELATSSSINTESDEVVPIHEPKTEEKVEEKTTSERIKEKAAKIESKDEDPFALDFEEEIPAKVEEQIDRVELDSQKEDDEDPFA